PDESRKRVSLASTVTYSVSRRLRRLFALSRRDGMCFALVRSAVPVGCSARCASRRRPMQTLRRTLAVLTFPTIAYLGAACERTDTPTRPSPPSAALLSSSGTTHWVNDDDPNGGLYASPGTSCNNPGYATVTDAVTAAQSGDRINVCPGT